jgi:hypothetical protein
VRFLINSFRIANSHPTSTNRLIVPKLIGLHLGHSPDAQRSGSQHYWQSTISWNSFRLGGKFRLARQVPRWLFIIAVSAVFSSLNVATFRIALDTSASPMPRHESQWLVGVLENRAGVVLRLQR